MTSPSPSSFHDRLAELQDEAEKQKVELTPEVKAYIQANLELIQEKISKGEDVTEDDMKFIEEVKMWVAMPEEIRMRCTSIEAMKDPSVRAEANKRDIDVQQWQDLLHVAEASGNQKKWIDEQFRFPGGGEILVLKNLNLVGCMSLTHLPENLKVKGRLTLYNCPSLTHLPEKLEVEKLALNGCRSLISLPENLPVLKDLDLGYCSSLTHLPENLKVTWRFSLSHCVALTHLPEGLDIGGELNLESCTALTHLPGDLSIGYMGRLFLSHNAYATVKEDADRLRGEGKIKGEVQYI